LIETPRSQIGDADALIVACLVLLVACCACSSPACSQCGRDECRNLTVAIELTDGGTVRTCCPRCALRYLRDERPAVSALIVREFNSTEPLDARRAIYVEGSDVHPCSHATPTSPPPTDDRGCCLAAVYDRCEPSLVAFASRGDAQVFARAHGGLLRSYAELAATSGQER
jgi:hypothetical protein